MPGDPTELLHRVIEAAEKLAAEWPQHCAKLKQRLLATGSLVSEISRQEADGGAINAASSARTWRWLLHLETCLGEAESVLKECTDLKHRRNPIARSRCASKLEKTTEQLKDLLQTEAIMGMHDVLQMAATHELRQCAAQWSLGLEARNLLTSEVFDKDRTFFNLKNGMGRLGATTSLSPHLESSASSSHTGPGHTREFDSEAMEAQLVPQFVFGMDMFNEQIQQILLGSENIPANNDGEGYVKLKRGSKWVGVWAKGGAGKTLLVQQAMSNPIVAAHFNGRVYLLVAGRAPDVVRLQEKLCYTISPKFSWTFKTSSEGKSKLNNLLQGKKCLLILDDVWEEGLLECFNVVSEAGSFILVTTRKQSVLQRVRATEVRLPELSSDNSMKLLCMHAFNGIQNLPDQLEEVVENVVAECKGHPLSLRVVGGGLARKMESHFWETALQKLREAEVLSTEYEEQLLCRLKLSYDDLGSQQYKECFLYFAAFPEGDVIEAAHLIQLWAGEGLIGRQEGIGPEIEGYCILGVLIGRSLIDVAKMWSKEQSLPISGCKIHDVLRDMGLYILRNGTETWEQRCLFKPGWQPADDAGGTARNVPPLCWLSFGGGVTRDVLPLGWLSFGSNSIGVGRARHKSGCTIMQAEKVSLVSSTLSSLPSKMGVKDLSPPLRVLLLGKCLDLTELDGAFLSHFTNLCVLDLSWASSMCSLPRALEKLRELVVLNLQSSGIESLPRGIGKLRKLEYLNLQDCHALTFLPGSGLSKLVSLRYFNTRGCGRVWDRNVDEEQGSTFPLMEKCFFADSSDLETLSSLTNLRKLWIGSLHKELLPGKVMGRLSQLSLVSMYFPRLKELPEEMSQLDKVQTLDLNSCCALKELPGWVPETMVSLRTLDLRGCTGLSHIPSTLGSLRSLIKLDLSACTSLRFLPNEFGHSGAFPSLQELWLFTCASLEAFPDLQMGALPRLFLLSLFSCVSLKSLPESISYVGAKLRILNLGECKQLALPSDATLAAWIKLEELSLKGMPIKALPTALVSLPSLKKLTISDCSVLESLPEQQQVSTHDRATLVSNLYFPNLQELIAANATSLTNIPMGLVELPQLRKLDITGCESLVVTEEMRKAAACRKGLLIKGLQLGS